MKKDISSVPASRSKMYRVLALLFTINMLVCVQCARAQDSIDSLSITMSNDSVFVYCEYQSSVQNITYFKCSPNGFNGPSDLSSFIIESPGTYIRNYVFTNMIPGKSYCVRAVLTDTIGLFAGGGGQVLDFETTCLPLPTMIDDVEVSPQDRIIDSVYDMSGRLVQSSFLKPGYYVAFFHSKHHPKIQRRGKLAVINASYQFWY
jgi:hypothetical protein